MIKQISLILLFGTLVITGLQAQKYQVKKDVLLKDKVPLAKLNGKVNVVKTDLTIENNDGEIIAQITQQYRIYPLPGAETITWLTYSFPQFGKTIPVKPKYSYLGKKQFLKYEFQGVGVHFYEDGLHEDELENFEDYSEQLKADTMSILNEMAAYKEILTSGSISKPNNYQVVFMDLTNSPDMAVTVVEEIDGEINKEDNILVGKIKYKAPSANSASQSLGAASSSTTTKPKHFAMIYKYLPKPVNVNGESTRFIEAGYIDFNDVLPRLYLYQDGRYEGVTLDGAAGKALDATKKSAIYMVENGYL